MKMSKRKERKSAEMYRAYPRGFVYKKEGKYEYDPNGEVRTDDIGFGPQPYKKYFMVTEISGVMTEVVDKQVQVGDQMMWKRKIIERTIFLTRPFDSQPFEVGDSFYLKRLE